MDRKAFNLIIVQILTWGILQITRAFDYANSITFAGAYVLAKIFIHQTHNLEKATNEVLELGI
jgi:hypothetical protein